MTQLLVEYSSFLLAIVKTLLNRALTTIQNAFQRRRRSTEHLLTRGRRLAELMAELEQLMTLMLAKHYPLAPASAVAGEAARLAPLVAETESIAFEMRQIPDLREATDELLGAALRAAEFAQGVSKWRSVDMNAWHATTKVWAAHRVRFRREVEAMA